jgi:hypothetical protein
LFFFLASERWLLARTVRGDSQTPCAVAVIGGFRAAQRDIARYLGTQAMINAGVGVATRLALMALGFPSPILWGSSSQCSGSFLIWDRLFSLRCSLLAGTDHSTRHLARSLRRLPRTLHQRLGEQLHCAVVRGSAARNESTLLFFSAVMVCAWMWGVLGAFLAVPLLVIIRSAARPLKEPAALVCLSRSRPARAADDARHS